MAEEQRGWWPGHRLLSWLRGAPSHLRLLPRAPSPTPFPAPAPERSPQRSRRSDTTTTFDQLLRDIAQRRGAPRPVEAVAGSPPSSPADDDHDEKG